MMGRDQTPERRENDIWVSTSSFAEPLPRYDKRREEENTNRCIVVRLNLRLSPSWNCRIVYRGTRQTGETRVFLYQPPFCRPPGYVLHHSTQMFKDNSTDMVQ